MNLSASKTSRKTTFDRTKKTLVMATSAAIRKSDYEIERDKPMPDFIHGYLQTRISHYFLSHFATRFLVISELNLDIQPRPKVPDLAIYPFRKIDFNKNEVRTKEPPICAIEILSEEQAMSKLLSKRQVYFDFGVKSYWLVLPATRTIYVYSSLDEFDVFSKSQTLRDDNLGITLKLDEIF